MTDIELFMAERSHRKKLIDFWRIGEGVSVLEIGCGQGETTLALAETVGNSGFVHSIDCADENYGSPETLGEARNRIMGSELGKQIKIELGVDILSDSFKPLKRYDYVLLSHCSWYFTSYEQLTAIFAKSRELADTLCFAEWDLRITNINQLCHYKSCHVQAICNGYSVNPRSNIKTLFHHSEIISATRDANWVLADEISFASSDLQDAVWERGNVVRSYKNIVENGAMPEKLKSLLNAEIFDIEHSDVNAIAPLPVMAFYAHTK
jgi:SAM-dependent methyltransferase